MATLWNVVLSLLFAGFLGSMKLIYEGLIRPRWFLRHVPGPPHESLLGGHMLLAGSSAPGSIFKRWKESYGSVIAFQDFLQMPRICIMDKRAIHHVLVAEPMIFPRPAFFRKMLSQSLGDGLLLAEGHDHSRQRKIMNPSFGVAHLKSLYPIILGKAEVLRDVLLEQTSASEAVTLNMYEWFSRTTLDIIASAGFGYEVNATNEGNRNELADAFNTMLNLGAELNILRLITFLFPIFRIFDRSKASQAEALSLGTMQRIGRDLVDEKKAAVRAEAATSEGKITKGSIVGKDLLSVLIKANMSTDLKESQRMSDKEVIGQITTFLLAGNDTTAVASVWALYSLCKHQPVQDRLREELLTVPTDTPTFDELNALPFLDAVMRETLRLHSPVPASIRSVEKDSLIPLAEPYIDTQGVERTELHVAKGTGIIIPILNLNHDVKAWGPDAEEFNPERWLSGSASLPEGATEIPSVNFSTFLAGSRSCIGFRFTLLELKAILFTLIRSLEFTIDPDVDIEARTQVVTRPRLRNRPEEGYQLPLKIRAVRI